jgi:signal transduction histidine kinase
MSRLLASMPVAEDSPEAAPRVAFSLTLKMLLITVALLGASFLACTWLVRVRYFPTLSLREFWTMAQAWVILPFCATVVLFVGILFVLNEWVLVRPLKHFLAAIHDAEIQGRVRRVALDRRDEWGLLGSRLNQFLDRLTDLRQQADLLYETSRRLGSPLEFQQTVSGILEELLRRFQLSSAMVFQATPSGELRSPFYAGVSSEFARAWQFHSGEGLVGVCFSSAAPRWVADAREESDRFLQELVVRQKVRSALFLPLTAEGQTGGVVAFFSASSSGFSPGAVESLTLFGQHLALAVRNEQSLAELKALNRRLELEVAATVEELRQTNTHLVRKVRELKTIYDLALVTAASTRVEDIIQLIIDGVKELVDVQGGAFFLLHKDTGTLEPLQPAFDRPSAETPRLACKLDESPLLRQVIEEAQPQILNFVEASEQLPASWSPVAIRSILALPLRHDSDINGLFCVVNKVNGLFTEDDVKVLSLLTGRVVEVLRRLSLDQQVRQRVQDLSVLQEIANHLPSPPVLADTVRTIGGISRQALDGVDACLFFLHHAESEALVMMGGDWDPALTFDAKALTIGASENLPLGEVFRESQPALYEAGAAGEWGQDDLRRQLLLQDIYYLPLTMEHRTIGVMAIGTRQAGRLTAEHRRLAGLIAEQVAVVIERSRLYERLHTANEKLEQINHLKNEFISMVSHELRTPLTTIKGFVSIVLNGETGPLNEQQRHFLETSDRAIDRLTLLVSDLLDISRIEAGQIKMQLRAVSVKELVSRVAANFAPQFRNMSLSLTLKIPDSLPPVMADPHRLTQVFDNLLSNAIKFTAKGGVTVSAVDKGDFVMVSVKDTGSGIPKEDLERIFEKFYQAKVGGAWPSKGTGLGLAIVRSIIESHRGKVWVESDVGKGADFRFMLPRARTEPLSEPPGAASLPQLSL